MPDLKFDPETIRKILPNCWSKATAKQWEIENPALGHCNVTTVVIYDLFGGEILSTPLDVRFESPHFYNRINGNVYDFTDSQFIEPIFTFPLRYEDNIDTREHAILWVKESEHTILIERITAQLV